MITNAFVTADGRYYVESYGNGWAYQITSQTTGASLWVQDDDACVVQIDTDDFTNTAALDAYTDLFEH